MAFVLIIAGAILFLTAIQGTTSDLGALLIQDVFGGFIYWLAAILIIGGLGYIKAVRPLSNGFLVLLILVLFVANRGFFAKLTEALAAIKTQAANAPTATASAAGTTGTGTGFLGNIGTGTFGALG